MGGGNCRIKTKYGDYQSKGIKNYTISKTKEGLKIFRDIKFSLAI